jgi:predicted ATPase
VHLMLAKIDRLPYESREILKLLACLGNTADIPILTRIQGGSEEASHAALLKAVCAGLIFRWENTYAFLHDRIQEAAYLLIPEEERGAVHLRIGRFLLSWTLPSELEKKIFEIADQFNRSTKLITSLEERERVAELNLIAGKRAMRAVAYLSALRYLTAGTVMLAEDRWQRQYELAFALELQQAECEFLTGNLALAEERLLMLSSRARTLVDRAAVTFLRVILCMALDQSDRGVEVCLEYLRHVGIQWSPHPTEDDVRQEIEQLWHRLGSRSIKGLINLPLMSDPDWRATMDVLTSGHAPALSTDENLTALIVIRMANISLEQGNSDGSSLAYLWLSAVLGPRFGNYRAGFRFGKLGLDLVEKRGLNRFKARVYLCFALFVNSWTRHVRTSGPLFRLGFDMANSSGDLSFASYSCFNLITNLLATGDPLGDVQW